LISVNRGIIKIKTRIRDLVEYISCPILKIRKTNHTQRFIKMATPRGPTTSMAKRGQIMGYAMLDGQQKMSLKEISAKTGVLLSTCSNIIRTARQRARESQNADLFADENLAPLPNSVKGSNEALTQAQKEHLVEVTLQDADHCRMTFTQLAEAGSLCFFLIFI